MKDEKSTPKKNIDFYNNSKILNVKKNQNSNQLKKYSTSVIKREMNNSQKINQIKQIIDITVTHFTVKCAYLCNQIEDMKKEFIEQLELISNKFISNDKKFYINLEKKKFPKLNSEIINFDNYNFIQNNNNNPQRNNLTNIQTFENEKRNMSLTFIESNKVQKDLNESNQKSNKTIRDIIKLDEMIKNPELEVKKKDKKKLTIQIKSIDKPYSKKELAIQNLMKSKILSHEDKLKLRFSTKRIYYDYPVKKILKNSKKQYQNEIKKIDQLFPEEEASITSASALNFIKKEHEKDTLCNEKKKSNIKFLTAIAILKEINCVNLKQAESIYKLVLKESKFDTIKSLFISYLKYLYRNTQNKKTDDINKFITFINKNKELLEQSDMMKDNYYMISLYSFGLKEIYQAFNKEINKRNKKKEYLSLIDEINLIESNLESKD